MTSAVTRNVPLTEREKRLVEVIVHAASRGTELTREQAGTAAGYGRGEVARVQASRALKRADVRAALMEGLRECATIDAAASYGVLRHLAKRATSERVRLDAALAGARIGGLDLPMAVAPGVGVVLNLHLDPALGALLAQRTAAQPQATVIEAEYAPVHSLDEGEGGQEPAPKARKGGGGGAKRQAAKAPRGAKTRAKLPPTGPAHNSPPKSSPGRKGARA